MEKEPPHLALIEESEEHRKKDREGFKALLERLSIEQLQIALERVEQIALNEKAASPVRRKARKDRIRTERAGRLKRVQ